MQTITAKNSWCQRTNRGVVLCMWNDYPSCLFVSTLTDPNSQSIHNSTVSSVQKHYSFSSAVTKGFQGSTSRVKIDAVKKNYAFQCTPFLLGQDPKMYGCIFNFWKFHLSSNFFTQIRIVFFLTKSTSFMTFLSSLRHCIDLMTSYPYEVNDLHVLRGLAKFMILVCLT